MRLTSSYGATPPQPPIVPSARPVQATPPTQSPAAAAANRFSVLNDFRYLADSDKEMLAAATGETIEPGFTDRTGPASAFAQQVALDRRTGALAPNQEVTAVYLRNAAKQIDDVNAGRPGFRNPYSGEVMDRAVAWLEAHGRGRADIRL